MRFQPQPAVFKWNTIQTSLDKSAVKRPSRITAPPRRLLRCWSGTLHSALRWWGGRISRDGINLRMVVGVAVFSALSTVFTSRLWRLMMDQTQFQSQCRILGFQWICLLTGPNHNSTNFNRRRLVTVTVFRRPTVITVPQHRRGPYSIHQLPWQFLSQKGNVCVRTHTSGGDIRLVKE